MLLFVGVLRIFLVCYKFFVSLGFIWLCVCGFIVEGGLCL